MSKEIDIEILQMKQEGLSTQEIADRLGLSIAQVKHGYRRARGLDEGKERKGFEEKKPRVHKEEDTYIITSKYHSTRISEKALKHLKKLYCLEKLTINQLCREMRIARRDFYLIKTAFSITKDDIPYTDEDLINLSVDDLVADSLQEEKRLYFTKLQEEEVRSLKAEVFKYRKQDYFTDKICNCIDEIMDDFGVRYNGPDKSRQPSINKSDDLMLEVSVVDLHLSKLSWEPEVGESYDYKIAEERYKQVIDDVYNRAVERRPGKILVPFGQDFFHTDTTQGTTTAGTYVDKDGRWQKQFAKGFELLVWTFDRFAELAPVEGVLVPGNHDKMLSYCAMVALSAWFKDRQDIIINPDIKMRKYIEFGLNLIGFTHGDKERGRIYGNMQVEVPQAWGRTKFKEWHTGHIHHEMTKENNGVIVRSLSSITATDAWHFEKGYVGNVAKSQSFLWHKNKGLIEIWHTNL